MSDEQNKPTAEQQNPAAIPTVGPRVANFSDEVVKSPAGLGVMVALENVIKAAVGLGFPEEKARRATSLWIMDIAWSHLLQATSILQDAFLSITNKPKELPPEPPVEQTGPVSGSGAPEIADPKPPVA